MRGVTARARSGYAIALDQCPRCGGVWCDRWELFPLMPEEAARIDAVDERQFLAPTAPPRPPGRCPRCRVPLQPFRDASLPADARIERCPVCDGMWMNRGELARAKRRARPQRPLRSDALQRLAAAYGAAAKWSTVANLDAATYADDGDDALRQEREASPWASAPWVVLRMLLRLLLRV